MNNRITEEQAKLWNQIAANLRKAKEHIDEAELILLLQLKVTEEKPVNMIRKADDAISGLAYLFTPQPEWTGDDSSDPKNFVINLPHAARKGY